MRCEGAYQPYPKVKEEYFARRKAVLDEMAAVREEELRLREAIQKGKKTPPKNLECDIIRCSTAFSKGKRNKHEHLNS